MGEPTRKFTAAELREFERMLSDSDIVDAAKNELGMSPEEIMHYLVSASVKSGDSKYLNPSDYLRAKYRTVPVSPTQWLTDPQYFGHVGSNMWDVVRHDFLSIMEANPRPLRVVFKGSIGWGKTFLSSAIMCRLLYELGCLANPQSYYGLALGSQISFINLAVTATHARRVFFSRLREMIDLSPWFKTHFKRNMDVNSEMQWPQHYISFVPGSSSELAALGENILGGVIEEANFFKTAEQKKTYAPQEEEWDHAKRLHDSIWRRMKSRYQRMGRCPGILILNSSAKYPDDFLEKVTKENDPSTVIIEHAEWETKPTHRYSGEKFYCFVGDTIRAPRILETEDEVGEFSRIGKVIPIPIEYKSDFMRDIEGAIRDIVGMNIRTFNRFITAEQKIDEIKDSTIPVPFDDRFSEGIMSEEVFQALRFDMFLQHLKNETGQAFTRAKMHPNAARYCHVDLGVTNCPCGITVAHVGDYQEVERRREDADGMHLTKEVVPVIYVDLILRIVPPVGGEILIETIRNIIYELRDRVGFRFAKITYDQFQSRDSLQILKKRFGEDVVAHLSVVRTNDPYLVMKEALYENRIKCYEYAPLTRELRTLQIEPKTGRIEALPNETKDVADSFAGAVWNATADMDAGIRSTPQPGMWRVDVSPEEKFMKDNIDWLTGRKKTQEQLEDEEFYEENFGTEDSLLLTLEEKEEMRKRFPTWMFD